MNKYIIILIIVIIVIIIYNNNCLEKFLPSNQYDDISQINENHSCCFIEKKFIYDKNLFNKGKFSYIYNKIDNPEMCKLNLYNLNNNKSNLFIEGDVLDKESVWKNDMCEENKSPLGSCRYANKECSDFITKDECDKLKMEWSENTCQDKLPFKFIDRIKYDLPEQNYEIVQMFPS